MSKLLILVLTLVNFSFANDVFEKAYMVEPDGTQTLVYINSADVIKYPNTPDWNDVQSKATLFTEATWKFILKHEGDEHVLIGGHHTYGGVDCTVNPKSNVCKKAGYYLRKHKWKWSRDKVYSHYLKPLVKSFYKKRWRDNKFNRITNSDIANYIFDNHILHGSNGIRVAYRAINMPQRAYISKQLIHKLNNVDTSEFIVAYKKHMMRRLTNIAFKKKGNVKFFKGWGIRTNDMFPQYNDATTRRITKILKKKGRNPWGKRKKILKLL